MKIMKTKSEQVWTFMKTSMNKYDKLWERIKQYEER